MRVSRWMWAWVWMALGVMPLQAEVPAQLFYQGRLARDGQAVTAAVPLAFRLYDADQGGLELFAETQTVQVVDGYYSTYIGRVAPLPPALFRDHSFIYLEITVDGTALVPRDRIVSVGYAMQAQFAQEAAVARSLAPGVEVDSGPVTRHVNSTTNIIFLAHMNSTNMVVGTNGESKVNWRAEEFDSAGAFSLVTDRFTVPVTGYYRLTTQIQFDSGADRKLAHLSIRWNGVTNLTAYAHRMLGQGLFSMATTRDVYLAANDYVEVYVKQTTGTNREVGGAPSESYFSGYLLQQFP